MPLFLPERSQQAELLDQPDIPAADLHRNLAELDTINRLLGGHATTLNGLQRILKRTGAPVGRPLRILDVGCGGGDTLRALHRWGQRRKIPMELTGVDLLPEAIAYAQQAHYGLPITWRAADYRDLIAEQEEPAYDVVLACLFCHHLYGDNLNALLRGMYRLASQAVLINDLHRHPLAYHSISLLTRLFSRSYLVRHDAPLSVWKGFTLAEWRRLLQEAQLPAAELRWFWAFRHQILIPKTA